MDIYKIVRVDYRVLVICRIMLCLSFLRIIYKQAIAVGGDIESTVIATYRGEVTSLGCTIAAIMQEFKCLDIPLRRKDPEYSTYVRHPIIPVYLIQQQAKTHLPLCGFLEFHRITIHYNDSRTGNDNPLVFPYEVTIDPSHVSKFGRDSNFTDLFPLVVKY